MTAPSVRGLVPILATPFTDAGALDVSGLRRLVEFQLHAGVDGVAVFGMASEGFALTAEERSTILREVNAVVAGAVPVVAGVNATSTATAVEQAQAAVDGGVAALMVLPPYLVKPSPEQVIDFYGVLGQHTGAEVMVQDAPAVTGVAMSLDLIAELSKLDGVTSIKIEAQPTAPKVGAVAAETPDDFAVLGGQNAFFVLDEYARGAVGTMPACEFADSLGAVLADWWTESIADAYHGFHQLLPLIRFGMQPGIAWAVHKQVLVRRGVISSAFVRPPARPLDVSSAAALDTLLDQLALPAYRGTP